LEYRGVNNITEYEFSYSVPEIKNGYSNKILHIDLSNGKIEIINVSKEMRKKFLGGGGYALKLVYDGTDKNTKYYSEENVLVFASGPLGFDMSAPWFGNFIAGTISPTTDCYVDSILDGRFGPLAKLAGFDAISITGKSAEDVILVIDGEGGKIWLDPAPKEEGCITVSEKLITKYKGSSDYRSMAAAISGIGGVNSKYGTINCFSYDTEAEAVSASQPARGGTGTVMRTKGLKAVVVKVDMDKINLTQPSDPKLVKSANKRIQKLIEKHKWDQPQFGEWYSVYLMGFMNKNKILPVHNYKFGSHQNAKKLYMEFLNKRGFSEDREEMSFVDCILSCARESEDHELATGPLKGKKVRFDSPLYDTAVTGASCGIFEPDYLKEYNWYCYEYGLDPLSTGITLSFLMDCYERGFVTVRDVGMDLSFGNKITAMELLHLIAEGNDYGRLAGEGVRYLRSTIALINAKRTGEDYNELYDELGKFSMECKGLEFSGYFTKESLTHQGGCGFSLKGANHDEAWLMLLDQVNTRLPGLQDKARALHIYPLFQTWFNTIGLYKLPWIDLKTEKSQKKRALVKDLPNIDAFIDYANGIMGTNKTLDEWLFEAERLYNFQKLFNLRQGYGTRVHDYIPERAMGPATTEEYEYHQEPYDRELARRLEMELELLPINIEEKRVTLMDFRMEDYEKLMDAAYKEKGWDENGIPKDETLDRPGLLDEEIKEFLDFIRY
jgi:aldehyde:ferredoxin oxidoreductase